MGNKCEIKPHEILTAVADIGAAMLEYGAEVYRVESSIRYILEAYGADKNNIDVFAIPSSIVVTITDEEKYPITISKRIIPNEIDLDKIDKLNSLSRHICKRKLSYEAINSHLSQILNSKTYPLAVEIICYGIVGFSFTIFFGGNVYDAVSGAVIAAFIRILQWILYKLNSNEFFMCVLCSSFAAFIAILSVKLGISYQSDKIIIGALMTLVPGIAITNCMRDLIMGDYMAGLARMADALLIALGIAVGVASVLSLSKAFII